VADRAQHGRLELSPFRNASASSASRGSCSRARSLSRAAR
jgi:hypothetical protein